jgi:hypothetical protein
MRTRWRVILTAVVVAGVGILDIKIVSSFNLPDRFASALASFISLPLFVGVVYLIGCLFDKSQK